VVEGAALEQSPRVVLHGGGIHHAVLVEAHRHLGHVMTQLVALEGHAQDIAFPRFHDEQSEDALGHQAIMGFLPLPQLGVPGQDLVHVVGGGEIGPQLRVGAVIAAIHHEGGREPVHQRHHVVDGVDHGGAQALLVAGHGPQARVGGVDGAPDGARDQILRIGAQFVGARPENRLEKLEHARSSRWRDSMRTIERIPGAV
jgi:hypothetical protein